VISLPYMEETFTFGRRQAVSALIKAGHKLDEAELIIDILKTAGFPSDVIHNEIETIKKAIEDANASVNHLEHRISEAQRAHNRSVIIQTIAIISYTAILLLALFL